MKVLVLVAAVVVMGCSEMVEPASPFDGEFEDLIEESSTSALQASYDQDEPVDFLEGSPCTRDANGDGVQDPGSASSCQTLSGGCRFQICQCFGGSLTNCTWSGWFGFGKGYVCRDNSSGHSVCTRTSPNSISYTDVIDIVDVDNDGWSVGGDSIGL